MVADLSESTNNVSFYVMRPGGDLTVTPVELTRDAQGRITQVQSKNSTANFDYQDGSLVTGFRLKQDQ